MPRGMVMIGRTPHVDAQGCDFVSVENMRPCAEQQPPESVRIFRKCGHLGLRQSTRVSFMG